MIHILIIWSNALEKKDVILNDLKESFSVLREIKVHWNEELFLKNLTVFYAHSQRHLNEKQYENLLNRKMQHCGNKDFILVVFEDKSPVMENRKTSSGLALVNANVFDKKDEYRQLTGGGHKIHTSNDEWETNKDLTVLFGKNTEDFLKWIENEDFDSYNKDCVGVNGFNSIRQLFYLLNNTIKYCVLRNHECLPDKYHVEGHGDIDLLVENKNYVKYLTLAHDVYNLPYRVYHTISIAGKDVPFDFRFVGDWYYDKRWEQEILVNRQLNSKGFYVPNDEDQFYTLLYHAYIQKRAVADDYIIKLSFYADKIFIKYIPSASDSVRLLDNFLKRNKYEYVRPTDKTVYFNPESLKLSNYASRHGQLISKNFHDENCNVSFYSFVFKKEHSYYKLGNDFLISNEVRFLKELNNYDCFPKIIDSGIGEDGSYLETNGIKGDSFASFFSSRKHMTIEYIRSFIKETIKILRILVEKEIVHRDFIGQNFIIQEKDKGCKVYLIDFGWAIKKDEFENCSRPNRLGRDFAPKEGYSDLYSFALTLKNMWPNIKYINNISNVLQKNVFKGKDDTNECIKILNDAETLLKKTTSIKDEYILFERRHARLIRLRKKIQSIIG